MRDRAWWQRAETGADPNINAIRKHIRKPHNHIQFSLPISTMISLFLPGFAFISHMQNAFTDCCGNDWFQCTIHFTCVDIGL